MTRRNFLKGAFGLALTLALAGNLRAAGGKPKYILNETAQRILALKAQGLDAERIAERLTQEYEVEFAVAYRDTLAFLSEARRLGIV